MTRTDLEVANDFVHGWGASPKQRRARLGRKLPIAAVQVAVIGDDHAHRRIELAEAAHHPVLPRVLVVARNAHRREQLLGDPDLPLAMLNIVAGVVYALSMPFVALVTAYVYFDARARFELEPVEHVDELPSEIALEPS